jgi:xanthine/uracil permease
VHPVDEVLPVPKLALYGFQHVVAFYAGAVLVPIIVAGAINLPQEELVKLITADLFTCGIASIIQAVGFLTMPRASTLCSAAASASAPSPQSCSTSCSSTSASARAPAWLAGAPLASTK